MSGDWQDSGWVCGGGGPVNLCRVASFVGDRDRRERARGRAGEDRIRLQRQVRYLNQRWRAAFDSEGKPVGFTKALKTIVLGGVDPSVRAEVWEFLLGCYALSSTAEYRQQLRMVRRERYRELIEQCQMMHSSIGTGSLAYTIGSKVMDVRIMSKDSAKKQAKLGVKRITEEAKSKLESSHGLQPNERFEESYTNENYRSSSPDSHDFGSARKTLMMQC